MLLTRFISLGYLLLGMVVFALTGCVNKRDLDEIKTTQQAILIRLEKLEKGRGAATSAYTPSPSSDTSSSKELEEIKALQKEILAKLDNIIKEEASVFPQLRKALQAREAAEIDYSKVYTIPIGHSPVKGPDAAPIVMVEFSDFQCPFCTKAAPVVQQVLNTYPDQVKFVYKHFPIQNIHEHAMNAAKASVAAHKQGKFWEMHDLLFKHSPDLAEEKLMQYAQSLNLDMERFQKDYASSEVEKEVEEDLKLGEEVQIRGTPTFFMNGKRLPSWAFEAFQEAIKEALGK